VATMLNILALVYRFVVLLSGILYILLLLSFPFISSYDLQKFV